jgi:hypothetical protein
MEEKTYAGEQTTINKRTTIGDRLKKRDENEISPDEKFTLNELNRHYGWEYKYIKGNFFIRKPINRKKGKNNEYLYSFDGFKLERLTGIKYCGNYFKIILSGPDYENPEVNSSAEYIINIYNGKKKEYINSIEKLIDEISNWKRYVKGLHKIKKEYCDEDGVSQQLSNILVDNGYYIIIRTGPLSKDVCDEIARNRGITYYHNNNYSDLQYFDHCYLFQYSL